MPRLLDTIYSADFIFAMYMGSGKQTMQEIYTLKNTLNMWDPNTLQL